MEILKGYILQHELYKKANVAPSLFRQLKGVEILKISNTTFIKTNTLPKKYQVIASKCLDLEKYYLFTHLSIELGMCDDYLAVMECHQHMIFESVRIGRNKLFKLSDEFIKHINNGLVPFKINHDNSKFADYEIVMQGIKIGFY